MKRNGLAVVPWFGVCPARLPGSSATLHLLRCSPQPGCRPTASSALSHAAAEAVKRSGVPRPAPAGPDRGPGRRRPVREGRAQRVGTVAGHDSPVKRTATQPGRRAERRHPTAADDAGDEPMPGPHRPRWRSSAAPPRRPRVTPTAAPATSPRATSTPARTATTIPRPAPTPLPSASPTPASGRDARSMTTSSFGCTTTSLTCRPVAAHGRTARVRGAWERSRQGCRSTHAGTAPCRPRTLASAGAARAGHGGRRRRWRALDDARLEEQDERRG